ncbi:Protein yippee-like [Aphelenchoides besseyi]|nr:Protein yippee-like [Aphelenchoides besseyi]KAI6212051.1 Protein yippee-like [Aphelenchoides besseyi]
MGRLYFDLLDSESILYVCKSCGNFLTNQESFQSDSFQGSSGKAYLFSNVVNIICSTTEEKNMTTGTHIVRDVFCKMCSNRLGWTYEMAYSDSQRFKEGQFILELMFIRKVSSLDDQKSPDSPSMVELLRYDSTNYDDPSEVGRFPGSPFVYAPPTFTRQLQLLQRANYSYGGNETPTPRYHNRHSARLRRANLN